MDSSILGWGMCSVLLGMWWEAGTAERFDLAATVNDARAAHKPFRGKLGNPQGGGNRLRSAQIGAEMQADLRVDESLLGGCDPVDGEGGIEGGSPSQVSTHPRTLWPARRREFLIRPGGILMLATAIASTLALGWLAIFLGQS